MPGEGYKSLGVSEGIYDLLKAEKYEGESFSRVIGRIYVVFKERQQHFGKGGGADLMTKEDFDKAIKELENDISVAVRDAVKEAITEMKRY